MVGRWSGFLLGYHLFRCEHVSFKVYWYEMIQSFSESLDTEVCYSRLMAKSLGKAWCQWFLKLSPEQKCNCALSCSYNLLLDRFQQKTGVFWDLFCKFEHPPHLLAPNPRLWCWDKPRHDITNEFRGWSNNHGKLIIHYGSFDYSLVHFFHKMLVWKFHT